MSERSFRVAIVGATGLVGREILSVLEERAFPISEVFLYAGEESAGVPVEFGARSRTVEAMPEALPEVDVAFLCGTPEVNRRIGKTVAAKGALVIDLEGAAADDAGAPLVLGPGDVPGAGVGRPVHVAHPAARLLVVPLRALGEAVRLRRVVATLVVPASAFGVEAVELLGTQTITLLNTQAAEAEADEDADVDEGEEARELAADEDDESSLAFRSAPLGADDGWITQVRSQSERLLGEGVTVAVQAVRVPVFYGQAASISVEMTAPITLDEVRKRLREAPSVILVEGDAGDRSTFDTLGIDAVQVSGLGQDASAPQWIHFWAMAENVRQGAALPAVALAESLLLRH